MEKKIYAIILCAGKGERAKQNKNKILAYYKEELVVLKTVKVFENVKRIDNLIIVHATNEKEILQEILKDINKPITYVLGGETRYDSVINALNTIDDGIVLIHDGARPFVTTNLIERCISSTIKYGSGVAGIKTTDSVIELDNDGNCINSTKNRRYLAQTPQAFMVKDIKKAYSFSRQEDNFTDDAGVYTSFIGKCKIVEGESENKKLTYKEDFIKSEKPSVRIGNGFDLHRLVENRKLILGGIEIPHEKGLLGHSDADVLTHAIMDALLSSVCLRDIGYHFSDKDEKYKDISSMILLDEVIKMVKNAGYTPTSISAVIMAEKPKMSKYIPLITENLAKAIGIKQEQIGLTLTTLEGIGIVGREEGISASAYCIVSKI